MIHPRQAWCIQVSITELCWPKTPSGQLTSCSNCTRGIAHIAKRHVMKLDDIERALQCLSAFPLESDPCPQGRRKVVGCFGAEPLLHPDFPEIVDLFIQYIPNVWNRGLWTSLDWKTYKHQRYGEAKSHVERIVGHKPNGTVWERQRNRYGDGGYLNWNMHSEKQTCHHSSVLIGIQEAIADENQRYEMISQCPYQREWSPLIGPDADNAIKFWFCEVAQTHSRIFGLNNGILLSDDCWKGDIEFCRTEDGTLIPVGPYAQQIIQNCNRCSGAMPVPGRRDLDFSDDISPANALALLGRGSPQVKRGEHKLFDISDYRAANPQNDAVPTRYIKSK